jgi:two-component system, chemotaxis family, sensor kinase CheA
MVDREKLQRRLLETFLEELSEHVESLGRGLLDLERGGLSAEDAATLVRGLFRSAHSLKGAARAVQLPALEKACHAMEDVLAGIREGLLAPTTDRVTALLGAVDAIEDAGRRVRSGDALDGDRLEAVVARLEAAAGAEAPAAEEAPAPSVPSSESPAWTLTPPSPPPAAEPPARGETAVPAASRPVPAAVEESASVRVAAEKVDSLLAWSGELLVARRRILERPRELDALRSITRDAAEEGRRLGRELGAPREVQLRFEESLRRLERELERFGTTLVGDARALEQVSAPLDDAVRRIRMLPFTQATAGLDRAVRDLARDRRKEVDLELVGGDVEIDRAVLERLRDPLRHLVRNAVDHGIEDPAARHSRGKPPRGRIRITSRFRGSDVEIEVEDDGRGFDRESIRRRAREAGLAEPGDDRELAALLFLSGFSTAEGVTSVSGRGVGLDVVKSMIEGLHGSVEATSEPGRGTCFRLRVPLTLTILRALLVRVRDQIFAIAASQIAKLARVREAQLKTIEGRPVLLLPDRAVPVVSLATALRMPGADRPRAGALLVAIVTVGDDRVALIVDELLGEQEILVKSLGRRIRLARTVAGATLLPSGRIAMVLNVPRLLRAPAAAAPRLAAPDEPAVRRRLLVVDDSLTTRTLEKSVLEAAGYEVETAPDGETAWSALLERGADLVVSDVEMPRLDGLALAARIRASDRFRRLPVILVTGRESEEDRRRGLEAGADAYLAKSAFDQRALLEAVAQLL